jgi:branched-chain amino acid transport system ATP-binding protein
MARALMAEPDVIMLDEPMAGVNPALTQSLLEHIKALRDHDGRTVIFIEHDMDVVQEISDWVVVLSEGAVISEGRPWQVASDPHVIEAYLGSRRTGDQR